MRQHYAQWISEKVLALAFRNIELRIDSLFFSAHMIITQALICQVRFSGKFYLKKYIYSFFILVLLR